MTRPWWRGSDDGDPRATLAKAIPRRPRVSWWLALALALGFAVVVTPAITAERWLLGLGVGSVSAGQPARYTVRAPIHGYGQLRLSGGVVIARGEIASPDEAALADAVAAAAPRGPAVYLAFFALTFALAVLFSHHVRRSTRGRLVRVQITSLALIALLAVAVKIALLATALSALVVPIALLALVPTMVLDRIVGLATGVLAALVISLLVPFDVSLALLLLVQTATAGLVIAEHPRRRWLAALTAGAVTTLCTTAICILLAYLISGHLPALRDPPHAPWLAAAIGAAIAGAIAVPLIPVYQLLVGEITQGTLFALEDLGHPVLRQIAEKAPGTWQHSLMMANMAELAANAIGANGRLVRVGAYFHDLGKSLSPKYFIENIEAGETSPHDLLPPEVSCEAIFEHVTEGIVAARKAGLHERIVDFMHMHHGNGVLEYFWAKCREQGNPHQLTVEQFRYPGHPPQSRETALLAICDAVEAASRTLTKPDPAAIDSLVQRIVYGKLHLGQLDESGLSMGDLRRISDSLRETIRHANHTRIAYPWQTGGQDASASASATALPYTSTAPRLDSLDRTPRRDSAQRSAATRGDARDAAREDGDAALAVTADVQHREPARGDAASEPADPRIRAGSARNAQPSVPAATPASGTPRATLPRTSAAVYPSVEQIEIQLPPPREETRQGMPPPPPGDDFSAVTTTRSTGPSATRPGMPPPPPPSDDDLADDMSVVAPAPRATGLAGPRLHMAMPPAEANPAAPRASAPHASAPTPGRPRAEVQTLLGTGEPAAAHRAAARPVTDDEESRITGTHAAVEPAHEFEPETNPALRAMAPRAETVTEPALPAVASRTTHSGWSVGLAARIDAALDAELRDSETQLDAELRALLSQRDPGRERPGDEVERLKRHAAALGTVPPRRAPHPTSEVDPDDIEAAIEVAPPARRTTPGRTVRSVKPGKPE